MVDADLGCCLLWSQRDQHRLASVPVRPDLHTARHEAHRGVMFNFFYGYWFKAKRKTVGFGWTILPTHFTGYLVYLIFLLSTLTTVLAEEISPAKQDEIRYVSLAVMAVCALVTFLKTNFRDEE